MKSAASSSATSDTTIAGVDFSATNKASVSISGVAPTLETASLYTDSGKTSALTSAITVDGTAGQIEYAKALSAKGTDITNKVTWSVTQPSGAKTGDVTISTAGVITVAAKAKDGAYTITATADGTNVLTKGLTKTATLTVTRNDPVLTSGTVTGADSIEIPASGSTTNNYTAAFFDQYGDPYTLTSVTWSVVRADTKNAVNGVSINATSGVLTVDNTSLTGLSNVITDTDGVAFTVTATGGGVDATKTVTVKRAASDASYIGVYDKDGTYLVFGSTETILRPASGSKNVAHTVKTFDQYNKEMTGHEYRWSAKSSYNGVTLDENTGAVTVVAGAAIGKFQYNVTDNTANMTTPDFTIAITALNASWSGITAKTGGTYGDTNASFITAGLDGTTLSYNTDSTSTTYDSTLTGTYTVTNGTSVQGAGSRTVTVTFTANDNAANGDYKGAVISKDYTVAIAKKPVTVTNGITASDKVYDGSTEAAFDCTGATFGGKLANDTLTVTATGTFADANVGTDKTVNISGFVLGGASAANYTVAQSGNKASTTAAITAKALTVTGLTATNRAYDGTTTVALTGGALSGVIAADTSKVTGFYPTTGTIADANVGTAKAVTKDDVTISGVAADNYTVTQPTVTVNITKAEITSVSAPTAWTPILANSDANANAAALLTAVGTDRTTLSATYAGGTTTVTATWTLTTGTWNAKGGTYTYTATLVPTDTTKFADTTITKTLSVTVTPVTGTATWAPAALTKAKAEITAASTLAGIGLPASITIAYDHDVANGTYTITDANYDKTLATLKGYDVSTADKTVTIKMTGNIFPAWATIDTSSFKTDLTITAKYPVTVNVTAPANITYGATLGDPSAVQAAIANGTDTTGAANYSYLYTGTTAAGKAYSSAEKPTEAGTYTVTATLNSSTHSGRGTSAQFTIAKKDVTVKFTGSGSLTYDNTAKAVTAAVNSKVGTDDVSAAITYTQSEPTSGTATATAPTNAGTYTVTATLTGAKAANYNLTGTTTATLNIEKATRTLAIDPTTKTLAGKDLSFTIKPTVTGDLDKSAVCAYSSSDTRVATVNNAGLVTAIANGTSTISVTVPATTNYAAVAAVNCTVTCVTQPITGVTVASTGTNDKLTATVSGTTITVNGAVTSDSTITVTPAYYSPAALKPGSATTVTATDDAALKTGGSFVVDVNGTEVTYKIDTSAVTLKPANIIIDDNTSKPAADQSVTEKTAKDAIADTTNNKVENVSDAAAAGLTNKAVEAEKTLTNDQKTTLGSDYKVKVDVTVNITAKSYDAGTSYGLEIKPTYTVSATDKDGRNPVVLAKDQELDNSMIKSPVKISVVLPADFPHTNLFVKHYLNGSTTNYEIIKVAVTGTGEKNDPYVATWYQSSFSEAKIYTDSRTGTVTYTFADGRQQTVTYTASDLGKTLPTDSKSGYTFGGWKFTTPAFAGTTEQPVYTTVTDAFLETIKGFDNAAAEAKFTQNSGSAGGGGATTYTITATAGEGGAISPTSASVESGKDQSFTITPNTGYKVKDVLVDGKSVGAVTTYTFSKVAATHTIAASFEKSAKDISDIFTDIGKTAWYHDAVQYVCDNGLMNGTGSGFEPDATMSRAMIVTTIYRLAGSPAVTGTSKFTDVKAGQWYTDAILWAAANGIAQGYSNGAFGVNDPVTREQLVTFFYRYAQFKGYDVSIGEDTNILSYTDALTISEYAIPAMQWACGTGLVQGDGNALTPKATATRAQNAAILMRFQKNVAK